MVLLRDLSGNGKGSIIGHWLGHICDVVSEVEKKLTSKERDSRHGEGSIKKISVWLCIKRRRRRMGHSRGLLRLAV